MKKLLLLVMAVTVVGCTTINDVGRHLRFSDSSNGSSDQGISDEAKQRIDHANAAVVKLQSDLQLAQKTADQVPDLQKQLAVYKEIGTPLRIKVQLANGMKVLNMLRAEKHPLPATILKDLPQFTITAYDSKLGSYEINGGLDDGIIVGEKFSVFRNGRAVGYIEITRVQPTVSIAVPHRGLPNSPFKPGDKALIN